MSAPGPMGYAALPTTMAAVITYAYQKKLVDYGHGWLNAVLISIYAEELAASSLARLEPCPADEGLRLGLDVMAEAFGAAMRTHGMYSAPIDGIEQQVRQDVNALIHAQTMVHERISGPPRPDSETAEDRAESQAEKLGGPRQWGAGLSQGGAS